MPKNELKVCSGTYNNGNKEFSGTYINVSLNGEYQEHKIRNRCYALAYDKDGNPKRNVGVFYPDMGCVYTEEMYDEDRGIVNDGEPKPKRRQRNKRSVAKKGNKSK